MVDAAEYDKLEVETEALRQELAGVKKQLKEKETTGGASPASPGGAASVVAAGGAGSPSSDPALAADLAKAKRRVEELQTSEKKLKAVVADLNNELERCSGAVLQTRQASDLPLPPPPADDAVVEAEVARRLEEELYLVHQRVEGEVIELTLELQVKVQTLEEELEAASNRNHVLENELARSKELVQSAARGRAGSLGASPGTPPHHTAGGAPATPLSSKQLPIELMASNRQKQHVDPTSPEQAALDQATAERNIATRVKDEALKEAAQLRTELQRKNAAMALLEAEVVRIASGSGVSSGGQGSSDANAAASLKQKDAVIVELQQQLSDARVAASLGSFKSGPHEKQLEKQLKEERAANAMLSAKLQTLSVELETTKSALTVTRQERDKALAAGKRAFFERQSALNDLESLKRVQIDHEALILVMQQKMQEENLEKVRECFTQAMVSYEILQERLGHAKSIEETQEILLDVLCEYEHRILNLNNEVMSLGAIVAMKEADLNEQWGTRCCNLESEVQVLHSQLADQKQTEVELRGVITALGASDRGTSGHFHVYAQPVYASVLHASSQAQAHASYPGASHTYTSEPPQQQMSMVRYPLPAAAHAVAAQPARKASPPATKK